jgi:hypothetical protein
MKDLLPNLLKALGVILISAFILFLFYPKDRLKDHVVNTALEVLGNKLLAMVPKEKEREVQKEFEAMRVRALEGKVDEEHLEQFVTGVLNAEAEGNLLAPEKIDSTLAALRELEVEQRGDEKRLQHWAERMHAFEKFQARWEWAMTDSASEPVDTRRPNPRRRAFYRVGPNFVVKIDTAALAQIIAGSSEHAHQAESLAVTFSTPIPPLPSRVQAILKQFSDFHPNLPIEFEQPHFVAFPDSLHFEHALPFSDSTFVMPPSVPVPPVPRAESNAASGKKRSP